MTLNSSFLICASCSQGACCGFYVPQHAQSALPPVQSGDEQGAFLHSTSMLYVSCQKHATKSLVFCNQQLQRLSLRHHMIRCLDTDNMVRSLRMMCTLPQVSRTVTLRRPSPVAMLSHTASCKFEASPLPACNRPKPP